VIRRYPALGAQLVRSGALPEDTIWQCMLMLLLQSAHDAALPWSWRSVCLEHIRLQLARLCTLHKRRQAFAADDWQALVQHAREHLAALGPGGADTIDANDVADVAAAVAAATE
jgi:hypothetical protein